MNEQINTKPVELAVAPEADDFYAEFNKSDIIKDYVKITHPELIKLQNPDGTINETIEYGTKDFNEFVKGFIQRNDHNKEKILNEDRSINDHVKYNLIENRLIKIVPKPLTMVRKGDAGYNPINRDEYKILMLGKFGIINPGPKNFGNLTEKIGRIKDNNLSMAEVIDLKFHNQPGKLLNTINDYMRFTIVLEKFADAPELVSALLGQFGGRVRIREKDAYQAIHINFQYQGVNVEIQINTMENLQMKKLDDIRYHAYNNKSLDERSPEGIRKKIIDEKIKTYCQAGFQKNDFDRYKEAVMDIYKEYLKKGAKPQLSSKCAHICMIARRAEIGQNKFARELFDFLKEYNCLKNMALTTEK